MIHPEVGYDGGKKTKGRKRHLLVNTLGLMMVVVVSAASLPERKGAKLVFEKLDRSKQLSSRLVTIWVDSKVRDCEASRRHRINKIVFNARKYELISTSTS